MAMLNTHKPVLTAKEILANLAQGQQPFMPRSWAVAIRGFPGTDFQRRLRRAVHRARRRQPIHIQCYGKHDAAKIELAR